MHPWFARELKKWYELNKRDLPWRHTSDPYRIWLSEVMLQQTQVATGLAYYLRFTEAFPTVQHLAQAHPDRVMKAWEGLGYYSRARNLHTASKQVVDDHEGTFPRTFEGLLALKGVGEYTAGAIASIAYGLPHAVVDGNVFRVLSRVFGIDEAIDSTSGKKLFAKFAAELLDKKDPGTYNQALMEFGAVHCKPSSPACEDCMFSARCVANRTGRVTELPFKQKKVAVQERFLNYIIAADRASNVIVNRRNDNDIWRGLYEFTLVESERPLSSKELSKAAAYRAIPGRKKIIHHSEPVKHVLTHRKLHVTFHVLQSDEIFKKSKNVVNVNRLHELAFPRVIENFISRQTLREMLYF